MQENFQILNLLHHMHLLLSIILIIIILLFCSFQSQCQSHHHLSNISSSSPTTSIDEHEDDLNKTFLCHPGQSLALLHFKSKLVINPSASLYCDLSYPKTETWKEGTDCCSSWDGVTCHAASGHVTGLDLSCSQLQGTIDSNSTLFSLTNLHKLNLAFNDFQRSKLSDHDFPSFVSLTHLNLSQSYFSGYIPSEISHLSNLVSLDLSWNYYLGVDSDSTVLKDIAQNLTHLRVLSLDSVNMSLVQDLDSFVMNLSSNLISLSISFCGLQADFPGSFLLFPNLQELDLSDNEHLAGSFPKSWSNGTTFSNLKVLYLSQTSFSGELPSGFVANLKSLKIIDLTSCNFSGSIPASLGNLTSITYLDLSYNHFSGEIPSSIGYLNQLSLLDMEGNMLRGPIPSDILNLTRLSYISFVGNQLEGPLPSSRSHSHSHSRARQEVFPYLEEIYLADNFLNGTIPSWLFALPSLTQIFLNNNSFTGHLGEFLSQSLETLDLSNNKLQGQIPRSISKSLSFTKLYLSQNSLSGTIDHIPWKNIQILNLHSNLFEGPLPFSPHSPICNATSLQVLDLSLNKFSGLIPHCLGNISALSVLNLGKNNFHGTIPHKFVEGSRLSYLNLNGNQLTGNVTRSLRHCHELEVLDLNNNLIADVFPKWLGILPNLQVLVLRSNKFYGFVDIGVKINNSFPMLKILDLSNNNFSGALPTRLIKNLKAMMNISDNDHVDPRYLKSYETSYDFSVMVTMKGVEMQLVKILNVFTTIDVSNNRFEGNIPKEIGNLRSLKGLNLSNNCLAGSIPSSIGKLINLEWLDLSSNKLVGRIPMQLVDLIFLAVLNLSHNYLHGPIPQGKQLNTFKDDSYAGNSGLCGFPLPKLCGTGKLNPPTQLDNDSSDSRIEFNWTSSYIGYGCGMIFGIAVGYLVFSIRSPEWLVKIVEGKGHKKVQRSRGIARVRGRTRN